MSKFNLRPALASDIPSIVSIYMSAFSHAHDLISLKVFPRDQESSHQFWRDMLTEEIDDPEARILAVTVATPRAEGSELDEEEVVAFAKWNTPRTYPHPSLSPLPTWPHPPGAALADHFFGALSQRKHELVGDGALRPYWYLELVATKPEFQGQGAAGLLMRWGLERADEAGVETYLEASPEGKAVYERFGFKEVGRLVVGEEWFGEQGEFVEVFMVREGKET
ncbi:hypothetical protein BP6252_01733 [Coleophoma cylindrospora]|uniref:N-acetyltransferase domain-containing protein n=1 Tax=Coleophoma cylindrospora TaxID=1849047 RepID=A0A3D8SU47_9HELO|nr:hypothetical protein BP6252_01733 [Coleophoma cylindrospora]